MLRKDARYLLVLFVCVIPSMALATPITAVVGGPSYTLQQVIDAGGLRVGDKTFTDWWVDTAKSSNALAPSAGEINVSALQVSGEWGIQFTGAWMAGYNQLADTSIIFKVTADAPYLIHDNTLKMTGYGAELGGIVNITENVYARDPRVYNDESLADKFVYKNSQTNRKKTVDHQIFYDPDTGDEAALPSVWIVKDIGVTGGITNPDGMAALSVFTQTFSQIPEPATLGLLALGGLVMLQRRARR